MFYRRTLHRSLTVAVLLGVAATGCRESGPGGATRIAILPLENLSGDSSLDWVSNSAANVIVTQLAQAHGVRALPAANVRDAYALRAAQALQGNLTVARGRLRFSCVVEDLGRRRTLRSIEAVGDSRSGAFPLLDQVARALNGSARPFPTKSEEALRLLTAAAAAEDFERAAAADPDFALTYLWWARWLAARGERGQALKVLEGAQARLAKFPPVERAEISIVAASLNGDVGGRIRALTELAALTPSDAQPPRLLGQLEYAAWRFEPAINWYRRALSIEPDNADLWNTLAYAQANHGEFDAARKSLAEYSRLAPGDPNAQDSLGEVSFMAGDFAEAEKRFLEASRMNASWRGGSAPLKAAYTRAMTGDVAGADAIFKRYLELRDTLKDPLIPYRLAQWEFTTGRRRQAMERMDAFRAGTSGEAAVHAAAQLAVWKRQTGDRGGARRLAVEAAKLASSGPGRRLAAILLFVTEPAADASEWSLRAERTFSRPAEAAVKQYALIYALLLDGHFREAALVLKQVLRQMPPAQVGDLRTLAIWALVEAGRPEEARPLANVYTPPEPFGEQTFGSLAMPRVLAVYARLAPPPVSARLLAAYEKLKGDLPDLAAK